MNHPSIDDHLFDLFTSESDDIDSVVRRRHHSVAENDDDNNRQQPYESSSSQKTSQRLTWNLINTSLFAGLALLSAATTAPITLIPTMSLALAATSNGEEWSYAPYYQILEVYDKNGMRKRWIPFRIRTTNNKSGSSSSNNNNDQNVISSSSIFASRLTSTVTLVAALGKFINGAIVDIAGARRLLILYGLCTSLALLGLRHSTTPTQAILSCAAVDFFSCVNWSSAIVILGAHYRNSGNEMGGCFERGLYVTSLACRCGSLLTIPLSSLLLRWTNFTWQDIAGLASCSAFGGVLIFYIYLTDSPGKLHDPQNPICKLSPPRGFPYHPSSNSWTTTQSSSQRAIQFCLSVIHTIRPSIRAVLISRVFWVVAAAHTGAMMVKQSERILGTYFRDTSYGVVTESKASAMTVFLSLGMLTGLLVGGKAFATAVENEREMHLAASDPPKQIKRHDKSTEPAQIGTRNMVAFLYCFAICMCYLLSFLAVPIVRRAIHLPVLVLILQVLLTLGLGFGVAVQYYHIPPIVSATYGRNRGLYTAYTEGVAGLLSSIVWRIVGGAVEEGNPQGGGWAYGWAAVALLLVVCGTLMAMILEIFFVGGGWHHTTKDSYDEIPQPMELPIQAHNSSWMDEDLLLMSSPLQKPARLNTLSTSALQFIEGSPARDRISDWRKSALVSNDSRDEEDSHAIDLLGIDDDGSVLLPISNHDKDFRESSDFDDPNDGQYNDLTEALTILSTCNNNRPPSALGFIRQT